MKRHGQSSRFIRRMISTKKIEALSCPFLQGLKLQGDLGRFGQTELSDIVSFAELKDGKIVTGSEYGKLLLWEGQVMNSIFSFCGVDADAQ
jgi:hypothetical protein